MHSVWSLVLNSVLLGFGLAMDAFSVSLVNGLREPDMPKRRMARIAGVFGGFQMLMPMIGWICVRTILEIFQSLQTYIPWIAFGLLVFIGGKMILEGIRNREAEEAEKIGTGGLLIQGIATSIDALSVGFAIAHNNFARSLLVALIIAAITFVICLGGLFIGKKAGTALADKAGIFGGGVLILIGIWILLKGLLGL